MAVPVVCPVRRRSRRPRGRAECQGGLPRPRFPRAEETPPTHRPVCHRSSGLVRLHCSSAPPTAAVARAGSRSEGLRDGRRSRCRRRCKTGRKLAHRLGPYSSGHQSTPSTRAGVFPSSRVRGRWNHLFASMSLYAPARSPTTSATKWSRTAIGSGVARAPAYLRVLDADTPSKPGNSSDPRTSCSAGHSAIGAVDWSRASWIPSNTPQMCAGLLANG